MSITFQRNKNGTVSVYDSISHWDKETKKVKTKRTYLGTMKNGSFVPSSRKRGGRHKQDISAPIVMDKNFRTDVENLYLKAENERLVNLLKDVVSLIEPTLKQESESKED